MTLLVASIVLQDADEVANAHGWHDFEKGHLKRYTRDTRVGSKDFRRVVVT